MKFKMSRDDKIYLYLIQENESKNEGLLRVVLFYQFQQLVLCPCKNRKP